MATKVYKNIYRHEIKLPNNPLKAVNSYFIVSEDKNLIIDTGFNVEECRESLLEGMKEFSIDFDKTDLLVTHLHSDHSGLAAALNEKGVGVYTGEIDGAMINEMAHKPYWDKFNEYKYVFGLDVDNVDFDDHPGYKYCPKKNIDFMALKENDRIQIGEYNFEVIFIPGHTPGHIGLYERKHKLFFCGDTILDRITPNIAFWGFEQDILDVYLKTLKKLYDFEIDYLFTAHRNIITDHKKRIDELFMHHDERLKEVESIISHKSMTVRDVASQMKWSLRQRNWTDFPNPQKWFATGEAMSHLEHLVATNRAKKEEINEVLYYSKI